MRSVALGDAGWAAGWELLLELPRAGNTTTDTDRAPITASGLSNTVWRMATFFPVVEKDGRPKATRQRAAKTART
jgi:hypothetical protein